MNIVDDVKALRDLSESVLLGWLAIETPADRRRQKALELLAEAGQNLHVACINLDAIDQAAENEQY
jgi:hypothetical protein